jgi:hypothetical protein
VEPRQDSGATTVAEYVSFASSVVDDSVVPGDTEDQTRNLPAAIADQYGRPFPHSGVAFIAKLNAQSTAALDADLEATDPEHNDEELAEV